MTDMIEFVFDYMENMKISADTRQEQQDLENGIRMYLIENGISKDEPQEYLKGFIYNHLTIIKPSDLKTYFVGYPLLSMVNQIVVEYRADGYVSEKRKDELYNLMKKLYEIGLEERYVPTIEVKQIIGTLS